MTPPIPPESVHVPRLRRTMLQMMRRGMISTMTMRLTMKALGVFDVGTELACCRRIARTIEGMDRGCVYCSTWLSINGGVKGREARG